jgi:hypothetical protein
VGNQMKKRKNDENFSRKELEQLSGEYKNTDNRIPEEFDLSDAGERNEFAERQAKKTK